MRARLSRFVELDVPAQTGEDSLGQRAGVGMPSWLLHVFGSENACVAVTAFVGSSNAAKRLVYCSLT